MVASGAASGVAREVASIASFSYDAPVFQVGTRRLTADDSGGNLDIMVLWTMKSECRRSGLAEGCILTETTRNNMEGLVNLAVLNTNVAFTNAGITTQLRLVHQYRHPSYIESSFSAYGSALTALRSNDDNIMDDVHKKRILYGADIVALLIDDSQYCGIGYIGPRIDLMFSVTAWNCAAGYYTLAHEIGHNLVRKNLLFEFQAVSRLC